MTPSSTSRPPASRAVLVEASQDLPLITLTLAFRRGATSDPADRAGLTRLLGRLMQRTGGGLDPNEIEARIDSLGGSLSTEASQSTLSFHASVISRSWLPFLDLLGDVLARPALGGSEFELLKRETQSELDDLLDNDRALALRWYRHHQFGTHPYGRSTIGTRRSVTTCGDQDLVDQHRNRITRDDLVVAISGDIIEQQAQDAFRFLAEQLPAGRIDSPVLAEPTRREGRRLLFVNKPERTQTQILIGCLGTHPSDPDHTALLVGNTVFGGTFGARLSREIRSERGWSYGAYSSLGVDRQRQAFTMWTFPKATDTAECIRHQLGMLESWWSEGVTEDELQRAKSYLERSHAFSVDTASKRAGLALDEEILSLPENYYSDYVARIRAVTRTEVNEAIHRRITPQDLALVVVGTEYDIGAEVRNAIYGLAESLVVPFDADPSPEP